jgi:DNA-directed RNA polymerase subunit H
MVKKKYDIQQHILVPEHSKLNDKEKKDLLDRYHITLKELPKIMEKDPSIAHLKVKVGDVVKIKRKSPTAGESIFYRGVINV